MPFRLTFCEGAIIAVKKRARLASLTLAQFPSLTVQLGRGKIQLWMLIYAWCCISQALGIFGSECSMKGNSKWIIQVSCAVCPVHMCLWRELRWYGDNYGIGEWPGTGPVQRALRPERTIVWAGQSSLFTDHCKREPREPNLALCLSTR